ncbi:MAG: NYN domain-containing protein [Christensenellales bacterium]|jgi:uncharacterized LabA/DUF88 family protein
MYSNQRRQTGPSRLFKVGVFYDGQYFFNVSNHYAYRHPRKSRISIGGLHEFICRHIAELEGVGAFDVHIIEAHYFRGRFSAQDAQDNNNLYNERIFDDILMSENITTHYLPLSRTPDGQYHEKGVDVSLALEAYELTLYKQFDVLVLIASDGDYVPLTRKLTALGTKVMVLSWSFQYTDDAGLLRQTRISKALQDSVIYPVDMVDIIDRAQAGDELIDNLFVSTEYAQRHTDASALSAQELPSSSEAAPGRVYTSSILSYHGAYGFIFMPPSNVFFHITNRAPGISADALYPGVVVKFSVSKDTSGQLQGEILEVLESDAPIER